MPHTFCDAKKAGSKSSSIALQPTLFVAGFSPVLRPSRSELGPVGWRRRWGVGACMFELQKVCGIGLYSPPHEQRESVPPTSSLWSRSEEHTSELQSLRQLVCRLLL